MQHYLSRLQNTMAANWDRKALCDYGGASYTFGELAANIERLHILFESVGIHNGDKIALCGKNQARWGMTFFAVNTYEAVAVPILADFTPDNICSIVNHSDSAVLFTDVDIWKKLDVNKIPSVKAVIDISDFHLLHGSSDVQKAFDSLPRTFKGKPLTD